MRKNVLMFVAMFVLTIACFSQIEPVQIKPKGGIFQEPVYIKMSSDSNTAIYYTTDGSAPTYQSTIYTDSIYLEDVLVLRAVTYIDGKRSKVNTQSYFTGRSYDLPVVSVSSDPENFWSYEKGIYVKGCCADSTMPYYGANFWKSWEYQCNVEMYTPEGKKCFNQLAGMSLFGGYSRMLPQKSLAIIARSKYGKKRFRYRIFKERTHQKYKSFIIRNSGGDFKRTQLRDAFMTQLAKPTGVAIQAYEPVIVYLNGQYWGVQNIREKISEHYLAANYKVDKEKVDILRHNGVKRHGYSKNYKFLLSFLRSNDLSNDKVVDSLSKFMDIRDYIRYNIAEVYSDNKDAGGNIRYFRERKPNAKWRWVFYDLDMGLSNDNRTGYASNTLKKFTTASNEVWPNPAWSTFIIRTLLKNKALEYQYINTFCTYLNTCFHADTAFSLFNTMAKRIEPEMLYHQKRWGSTLESWHKNLDIVREFIQKRPAFLYQHLDEKFGLDTTILLSIKLPEDDVCTVKLNGLEIKRNFEGRYFTNIPQTISVKPKHDYQLVGWKNRPDKEMVLKFTPTENMTFEPIIVPRDSSQLRHQLIINEVNFKQPKNDSSGDWVELYNRSAQDIYLDGFTITDRSYTKGFKIEKAKVLARDFILICSKKHALTHHYRIDSGKVVGGMDFNLSKEGELIKLYDDEGLLVDFLSYDHSFEDIDSVFSLALTLPDSAVSKERNFLLQASSPLENNPSHQKALVLAKAQRERQAMIKSVVIGSAFGLTCIVGILLLVKRRKRKQA